MLANIGLLLIGLTLLAKGADTFIEGASNLAKKFKIPSIVIGLTIVAMGTSAPEASISIVSALKGNTAVTIGNVIGSNISNILLILGVTSAICALKIQKNTLKYEIPFLIFISTLLVLIGHFFNEVSRISALILLALFLLYLCYLYKITIEKQTEDLIENKTEDDSNKKNNILKIIFFIILGLIMLVYGSDLTVDSAINIAKILNISDRIIGLTIVAVGTSLPELITCIVAAIKKQSDIAIGNIVGSNIFNVLLVLGITGVICPIKYSQEFLFDGIIALVATLLLFLFTIKNKILARWQGIIFVMIYIIYLIFLITK